MANFEHSTLQGVVQCTFLPQGVALGILWNSLGLQPILTKSET